MADSKPQAGEQVRFLGCNGYPQQLEDANENVFPRKGNRDAKIDGAVAAIMAVGRAMLNKGEFMSPYADDDYDPTDARLD